MLASITLATTEEPIGTWLGSTAGMVLADVIAIAIGAVLGAKLPERPVKIGAAIAFVVRRSAHRRGRRRVLSRAETFRDVDVSN